MVLLPATFSLHHRKRSAKDGASFVFKKSWQVFAENLREKVAGMQLFPAFQGSAFAPFLRNGCAALPIGARLLLQKESPTQLAGHSKFSPYGNSERYATTIRTCFCRVFRNLYMSKVNFFHKMCQKPGIEPPTSLACSFFLRSQAHHPF